MGFDARLQRYFPAVLLAVIALIAYFQASAIGGMVGTILGNTTAAPRPPSPPAAGAPTLPQRSGNPILARNPFDSETGPLDGSEPYEGPDEGEGDSAADAPPLLGDVPTCGFGRVVVITTNEDPEWAFAFIEDGAGKRSLRHVGDPVEGHTLEALGWDRVWLVQGNTRCQLKLGDKAKVASRPPKTEPEDASGRRRNDQLAPELASKIRKVSDTEFEIERSVVDEILEQQAQLMRRTRLKPIKDGDKVVGLQVSRIRPGTLFDVLGLKDGDQLQSINGFDLSNPQKALEAYGRLRQADSLSLKIVRGGSPVTVEYRIQ
jgi:general secretion pathway protein C